MNTRSYLERFENKKSPNRISLNFEKAIKYNMYSVYITDPTTGEEFLFEGYKNDKIIAKEWNEENDKFDGIVQLNPDNYTPESFSGIYYYKAHEISFSSLYDITPLKVKWFQFKATLDNWKRARQKHQYRMQSHNVKQQFDVLKAVVDLYMDATNKDPINFIIIMTKLHSSLWFYHDNRNKMKKEVELYLNAYTSTGDLSTTDNLNYKPTGKAILTLQNNFFEIKKYRENKYIQQAMLTTAFFSFIAAAFSAYGALYK